MPLLNKYFTSVRTVVVSPRRQLLNMANALLRGRSAWVHRFWSSSMQREVDRRLRNDSVDMVYCYTTRMGSYVENRTQPYRILDFVDAVFLLASRMAARARFGPKRWLLRREALLIECEQLTMGARFDECWIVSAADRDAIADWEAARTCIVPQAVDVDCYAPVPGQLPEEPTLLFVGYMGPESVAALQQFYDQAFHPILQQFPNLTLNVAGANPPRSIVALGRHPHINVLGFVPDLRHLYARAHCLIAPMPFVAGVQTKVLEALAMGIPAVVTRQANVGIRAGLRQGVFVVEDLSEFAAAVSQVLSRPDEWRRRALENGRPFVAERFRWEAAAERVREIGQTLDMRTGHEAAGESRPRRAQSVVGPWQLSSQ